MLLDHASSVFEGIDPGDETGFKDDDIQKFYGFLVDLAERDSFPESLKNLPYQVRSAFHFAAAVTKSLVMKEAHQNSDLSALSVRELSELASMLAHLKTTATDDGKGGHFEGKYTHFKSQFENWSTSLVNSISCQLVKLGNANISIIQAGGDEETIATIRLLLADISEGLTLLDPLATGEAFTQLQTFQGELKKLNEKQVSEKLSKESKALWDGISTKLETLKNASPGWSLQQLMSASIEFLQEEMTKVRVKELGDAYSALRDSWAEAKKHPESTFDQVFDDKFQSQIEGAFKMAKVVLACMSGLWRCVAWCVLSSGHFGVEIFEAKQLINY